MNPPAAAPQHQHIRGLDGLRAFAGLTVFLSHCVSTCRGGFLGVDLFFVLSGYLITHLLLEEHAATGTISIRIFYMRRACRLMPALLAMLLLDGMMRPFYAECEMSWWRSAVVVVLDVANFFRVRLGPVAHTWSLSLEEQFYFVWPLLLLVLLRVRANRVLAGWFCFLAALSAALLRAYLWDKHIPRLDMYGFPLVRVDALLLGALAGLLAETAAVESVVQWLCRLYGPQLILVGFFASMHWVNMRQPWLFHWGFTFVALLFAALVSGVAKEARATPLMAVLDWAPVRWIGKRSYGLYLYRYPIIQALEGLHARGVINGVALTCLEWVLPFAVAALSYRFLEVPFLKQKSRFRWHAPAKADSLAIAEV